MSKELPRPGQLVVVVIFFDAMGYYRGGELTMETVCVLFEFQIYKSSGEWHVSCGFPLKQFKTKREAVSWCKRAARAFHYQKNAATIDDDGTPNLTPEYEVAAKLKQLLMACE
jgi:hypothetical protein